MYWTVIVPWVPKEFQTEWHPTEQGGAFDPLSRGAFKSEDAAITWAREHLRGAPYSLSGRESPEESDLCDALEKAVPLLVKLGDYIGNDMDRCEVVLAARNALQIRGVRV